MTKNYLILIVGLILILVATFMFYKKAQKNEKTQTIIPNNLVPGPIVHDKLSDEQIEKITKIQTVFYDVYLITAEYTFFSGIHVSVIRMHYILGHMVQHT